VPMIRTKNKNHLVMFEPVTWSSEPYLYSPTVGFSHPPGGFEYANQTVFAYHYYSEPNLGDKAEYFDKRAEAAKLLKVGAIVTEFGLATESEGLEDMSNTMDIMESHQQSWIAWEYKKYAGALPNGTCTGCGDGPWFPNGTINWPVVSHLSRTYAQAVAGRVLETKYNQTTKYFELLYEVNSKCKLPTEIYLNEDLHYAKGFICQVSPKSATCQQTKKNQIQINDPTLQESDLVLVTIQPK